MKIIKLLSLSLIFSGTMLFSSCEKEGCTNPAAENYDMDAETSDGSCTYSVDVVFWFNEETSLALQGAGVDNLKFFLNEESVGTAQTATFWEAAPACDKGGIIKFSVTLEKASYEPFYYSVTDSADEENEPIWSGIVQLDTDECKVLELSDF